MSWNAKALAQRQLTAIAAAGRTAALGGAQAERERAAKAEKEACGRELLRQVTARLKEGLPGKTPAGVWGSSCIGKSHRSSQAAMNTWAKALAAQITRPSIFGKITGIRADMVVLDDLAAYPIDGHDDRPDAMKYAFWSMPVARPEDVVEVSTT